MGRRSRLSVMSNDIAEFFEYSEKDIYTLSDLRKILETKRISWGLPWSTNAVKFTSFLLSLNLHEVKLRFLPETITRYFWGEENFETLVRLCLTLKKNSYLSHSTAMFMHKLTNEVPKEIFVSWEQSPKPKNNGQLLQENINKAFQRSPRVTNFYTFYKNYRITLLNGKAKGNLGVVNGVNGLVMTDLERTLIDATVKPIYSGGVHNVLEAYRVSKGLISVQKLRDYLEKLDYTYPYHQVIGFYLEQAGYDRQSFQIFENNIIYDFFLTYQMKEPAYSERWRLYYPNNLLMTRQ